MQIPRRYGVANVEELFGDSGRNRGACGRDVPVQDWEVQGRDREGVERVNARGRRNRERSRERSDVDEHETRAANRYGKTRNALRAQGNEPELGPCPPWNCNGRHSPLQPFPRPIRSLMARNFEPPR